MRAILRLIGASLASLARCSPRRCRRAAAPAISGPSASRAARPTDHPDPARHSYSVPEAPQLARLRRPLLRALGRRGHRRARPRRRDGEDGDGVPDYVERVLQVGRPRARGRERQARLARAALRRPPRRPQRQDRRLPERARRQRCSATPRPTAARSPKAHRLPRRLHGYLVLDNDYDPFQYPGTKPLADLEVTFAHEYCHILQMGYDAYQDAWFAESTAVWMEDQVYNGIDDYLRYVRRWVRLYRTPLTANSIREYGATVWNEWLVRRYGRDIIRERLGARPPHPARRLLGRQLRRGDPRRRAAPTSATTSPASPATSPSGAPAPASAKAAATPTCRARAACRATAGRCSARSTTPPSSSCGCTLGSGRAVVARADGAARASPPGWRSSVGSAESATAASSPRLRFRRARRRR